MKKNISIFSLLILSAFLMFFSRCATDDGEPSPTNPSDGTPIVFNSALSYGTMTDIDGNIYKTITIGTQTWMAENLRTTKYRDGSEIPNVTDGDKWYALITGAYCNYDNTTNPNIIATYGRLYNGHAVSDIRNIAPTGWHVPSPTEWELLIKYSGGWKVAGGKLKETGTTHWYYNYNGTTNETGFTALPGGYRRGESFADIGLTGYFRAATEGNEIMYLLINFLESKVYSYYFSDDLHVMEELKTGGSVRCVRD
jgi:uncharacterized protein (TIGR02145 family)